MEHKQNFIRGILALIALISFGFLAFTNPVVRRVVGGVLWSREYNASLGRAYAERNFHIMPRIQGCLDLGSLVRL